MKVPAAISFVFNSMLRKIWFGGRVRPIDSRADH